jgi:hypothetical protein
MTDFEAKKKSPWSDLPEAERAKLLDRLVGLIVETVRVGIVVAVRTDHYAALDRATKREIGKPYQLAANVFLGVVARWLIDESIDEKAAYFCETGDLGQPGFRDSITAIIKSSDAFKQQMRIHSVTVGSKDEFVLLQTADLLAWEVTRHLPKRLGLVRQPIRLSLQKIFDAVPLEMEYFDDRALRAVAAQHTPGNYERVAERFGLSIVRSRQRKRSRRRGQ